MVNNLKFVVKLALAISVLGYILVVLKEKIYYKNNVIFIDKNSVTDKLLNKVDIKSFVLGDKKLKAGDEIKVTTASNQVLKGILVGIKKNDLSVVIVTYRDEIKECKISNIEDVNIISRYGHFF